MSICIIHLSDGKVAGVYSNTHEPMEVMVMERDGPRMTEEQQARYRAFQTMVKYGLVMDWRIRLILCRVLQNLRLIFWMSCLSGRRTAQRTGNVKDWSCPTLWAISRRRGSCGRRWSVLPARAGRLWRSSRRKSGISLESTRMISSRYFWSCARRRTVQMPLGERSA